MTQGNIIKLLVQQADFSHLLAILKVRSQRVQNTQVMVDQMSVLLANTPPDSEKNERLNQPIEIILNKETVQLITKTRENSEQKGWFTRMLPSLDIIAKLVFSFAALFFSYTTTCSTIIEKTKPTFTNSEVSDLSKSEEQDIEILKTYMATPLFYFTYGACYFCDIRTMIRMYFNREPREPIGSTDSRAADNFSNLKQAGFFPLGPRVGTQIKTGNVALPSTGGQRKSSVSIGHAALTSEVRANDVVLVSNGSCLDNFNAKKGGWIAAGVENEASETLEYADKSLNPFKLSEQILNDLELLKGVFLITKSVNLRPSAADWSKTLQVLDAGTKVCIITNKMLKFIGNQRQVWVEIKFEAP